MKKIGILLTLIGCFQLNTSHIQAQTKEIYTFDKSISLPGDGGYDYLFADETNRKLYVSHGTCVNVIDLNTEQLVGTIDNMKRVHGIAIANNVQKGFISDGNANAVIVFDIHTFKTITTIPLSGKKPDAIMFDAFSNHILAFNGGSDNASVIDINTLKEIITIPLEGGPEFAVADGHGLIYNNLEDKNAIKVIDSKSLKVLNTFSLASCKAPSGLAIDTTNQKLFTVCTESKEMKVVDIATGSIVASLPIGAGVDAVAYDAITKLIFCSCGDGTTTIIQQNSATQYEVVQKLITQKRARTMALDNKTHKIYLSVASFESGTKTPVTGSFKVLVYRSKE